MDGRDHGKRKECLNPFVDHLKELLEEASELLEEGIEVATIPWVDKSEN